MKKAIVVLLVIQILLTTGCSLPFFGKASEEPLADVDGLDFIRADEDNTGDGSSNTGDGSSNTGDGSSDTGDGSSNMPNRYIPGVPYEEDPFPLQALNSEGTTGVLSSAITSESENEFTKSRLPVTIYYQDKDGYLIPMTRWIMIQPGIARAAINLDIDSPINREETAYYGVYPVIPSGTEILGIDIRDGVATIDFSRQLLKYNDARSERNIVASIVYTLTEFKTISKVRILVNGYIQDEMKFGTDISEALGRDDICINREELRAEGDFGRADVFLFKRANEAFAYLVPVTAPAFGFVGEMPEVLVKQLLAAASEGKLVTEMPEGVELLECNMTNGVLTLNFSDGFTSYGGNTKEEGILKQIVYTVRQVDGVKTVKILVEGKRVELPEGTNISAGLEIPVAINDVMDR